MAKKKTWLFKTLHTFFSLVYKLTIIQTSQLLFYTHTKKKKIQFNNKITNIVTVQYKTFKMMPMETFMKIYNSKYLNSIKGIRRYRNN